MITLNNFLKQDVDVSSLPNKLKTAYNFTVKYIEIYGTSKAVDDAINKSIQGLNKHINNPSKPKQQTLTSPIDIFIHKAGSTFRGIPTAEIKTLLAAITRFKKDKEDWAQYNEDGDLGVFNFTEKEESALGIPENYNSKNQPKTNLLTTDNYYGELKLSEVGETILAAYEKFASKKANLKPITTGQLMLFGIDGVGSDFTKSLKQFFAKTFKGNIIVVAYPKEFLLKNGFPSAPIVIRTTTLADKVNKHQLKYAELKHLPTLINNPLMLFKSKVIEGAFNVILEKENHEGLLCCSIHLDKKINQMVVSEIASIHGRNINQLINWVNNDLLIDAQTKKIEKIFSDSGFNSPKSKNLLDLIISANINKNITNPTPTPNNLNEENNSLLGVKARKNEFWTEIHGEIKLVEMLENGMITWHDFTKGKCTGIRAKSELFKRKKEAADYFKVKSLNGVDNVNEQFNKELDLLIQGKLPKNHVFYLGDMSDILNALSVKILPIEMQANRLYRKATQKNHLFDLALLKNLPEKLNNPIMVFNSKTVEGSLVVLIELASNDNNLVVAIELNKQVFDWKKGKISIQSIRSIYPKSTITDVLNWIEKDGLLLWVSKKKALDLLVRWRSNYANATQQIKGCTNIVQNFNNPTPTPNNLNGENNNLFGLQPLGSTKKGKTYRLRGDLGQFLGEYDRNNYTIVVRGDKGAGKSRLLYQLINAFAAKQHSVAFLSLEMGLNSSITERYKNEYISKRNLKRVDITDLAPTYENLNEICKKYDVVAIDSWTKLRDITQNDFDRLQKENPGTIIICIFQSTTGKITRGGNMPEYDAGMVIQVNNGGLAECEKNRYAPTDKVYNVFTKKFEEATND